MNHRKLILSSGKMARSSFLKLPGDLQDEIIDGLDTRAGLQRNFQDKQVRIPVDQGIRRAHHEVKKLSTSAGNISFDANRSDAGHAD